MAWDRWIWKKSGPLEGVLSSSQIRSPYPFIHCKGGRFNFAGAPLMADSYYMALFSEARPIYA